MPEPGDILLWETRYNADGSLRRYGQLAFVENVDTFNTYVSESRLVIQEKASDTPKLPEGIDRVVICEKPQSIEHNGKEIDIFGVKLYKEPDKTSEEVTTLQKFQEMQVLSSSGPSEEMVWIRSRLERPNAVHNIENALTLEKRNRMWYKLQDVNDDAIVGWALLEDRNQPDEDNMDVHSVEHNFTGIGIYGHKPFMYDIEDSYIIRTPDPEKPTKENPDFGVWRYKD